MDKALLTTPPGFTVGCGVLSRLCASAMRADAASLVSGGAARAADGSELACAQQSAELIFRAAARAQPTLKQLKGALGAHTDLSPAAIDVLLEEAALVSSA